MVMRMRSERWWYFFQIGLEPCGARTCQDEVSTSSVSAAVTEKTKHRTENSQQHWTGACLGVTTPSTSARLKHSNYLTQNGVKEATLRGNFRARARRANFFETTLSRSFQGVRIPSVTSRWSCSKTDKSNCCSHETLFHLVTCKFKRLDAVNYALNSWVGKTRRCHDRSVGRNHRSVFWSSKTLPDWRTS